MSFSLPSCLFRCCLILCLQLVSSIVQAQGNLLVTPNRIVFEGQQKIQELNLANTGKDTASYQISFMEIRMKEDGIFEQINEPDSGQYFASSYLRLFPRSVTLAPNEAQSVKVQLSRHAQIPPGEYRSHLYFRAEPRETSPGDRRASGDSGSISVTLTPVFGITIPAIIRIGTSDTKVSLSDLSLSFNDGTPVLQAIFHREGNMSVYGNIKIEHISPKGTVTPAGLLKGVAVYTPTRQRKMNIRLNNNTNDIDYHTGSLRIVYTEHTEQPKALPKELATAELALH